MSRDFWPLFCLILIHFVTWQISSNIFEFCFDFAEIFDHKVRKFWRCEWHREIETKFENIFIFLSGEPYGFELYKKKRCRKVLQFQYQISKDHVFWVNNIRDLQYCTIKKIKNYEYLYSTVELMATFRGNVLKTTKLYNR